MKRAVAFLDKAFPADHEFVDGLLCPRNLAGDARITVVVERGTSTGRVRRRRRTPFLCTLPPRRGFGRVAGMLGVAATLIRLRRRRDRAVNTTLFVRNDPGYLVVCLIGGRWLGFPRVVFQSSFPHEQYFGDSMKGAITRWIFARSLDRVDCVVTMTPEGRDRLDGYARTRDAAFLPVCIEGAFLEPRSGPPSDPVRLLYLGTHRANRRLDVVYAAAARAASRGARFRLTSIGATPEERRSLQALRSARELEASGILSLREAVSREQIPGILRSHDVGLSLLPPDPLFVESTPTKLVEYLGAGLPVLASRGIPFQERVVTESGGGTLVEFETEAMARAIEEVAGHPELLAGRGASGHAYANAHLRCACFWRELDRALWG